MKSTVSLSARSQVGNANHHLWNNHGTWWCHFTLHLPDFTKRRLRRSLGTICLTEARHIRDFLLAALPGDALLTIHSAPSLKGNPPGSPLQLNKQ